MTAIVPGPVFPQALAIPAQAPAGFWRRYLAYCLDWLLLAPLLSLLLRAPLLAAWANLSRLNALLQDWLLDKLLLGSTALPSPLGLARALLHDALVITAVNAALSRLSLALLLAIVLAATTAAIYFVGFEASPWQATPGKRLLGIRVVDRRGQRLGGLRTGARFLAGGLSWLSLNLGHALAGWRADGRALHDLIAGSCVVALAPMPRWARWFGYAQLALALALIGWLLYRLLWLLLQLQRLSLG